MRTKTALLLLPLTLAFATPAIGQQMPSHTMQPTSRLGPVDGKELEPTEIERIMPGMPAPDFTLARYGGGTVTLSAFRGKKNVVLMFYRGYWCPYCVKQLREMRTLLDAELRKNTELLVVSIDGENETKMTVTRIASDSVQPDFTFLSDPDHAVIARYGIMNPAGSRRGIPHPATYLIDRKGVVQWRDLQTDYKIRPTNSAILTALAAMPPK